MAALCAVDERTYLAWESGERSVPAAQLALLSDLYGVASDYLLGSDEDENGADTIAPNGGGGEAAA